MMCRVAISCLGPLLSWTGVLEGKHSKMRLSPSWVQDAKEWRTGGFRHTWGRPHRVWKKSNENMEKEEMGFGQVRVKGKQVTGRRLWNNARHGHKRKKGPLNLSRASASLFPEKRKVWFRSRVYDEAKEITSSSLYSRVSRRPPISGWFSRQKKKEEFAWRHTWSRVAGFSDLFWLWKLGIRKARCSYRFCDSIWRENLSLAKRKRPYIKIISEMQTNNRVANVNASWRISFLFSPLDGEDGHFIVAKDTAQVSVETIVIKNDSCAPPSRLIVIF